MDEFEGTVRNGVIVVDDPQRLPEGMKVIIRIPVEGSACDQPTLSQRLLRHAGKVKGLPVDLAEQHDHYVHGVPKR